MQKQIDTIQYRGFTITIFQTPLTRFGILYRCENNTGETKMGDDEYYSIKTKATDAERKIIDQYLTNNQ